MKLSSSRVQRDPSIPILRIEPSRGPILAVPHDRQPSSGKLNPQLMTASRGRTELELAQALAAFHDTIMHPGHLPFRGWLVEPADPVELMVLHKQIVPLALWQFRLALDDGPVDF